MTKSAVEDRHVGNVRLWTETGTVAGYNERVSTQVTGGGHSGHVRINSRNRIEKEVFVTTPDGYEKAYRFGEWDLPIRQGQTISVISGVYGSNKVGKIIAVYNHNLRKTSYERAGVSILAGRSDLIDFFCLLVSVLIVLTQIPHLVYGRPSIPQLLLVVIVMVYWMNRRQARHGKLRAAVDSITSDLQ